MAPPPQQQQPQPGVNLVPAAPPADIFNPAPRPPTGQAQPNPQPPPEEEEPPPSAALFSAPNASPTSEIINPRALLGDAFRTERSAEAGGGEKRRAAVVRLWLEPDRPAVATGDKLTVAVKAAASRGVSHLPLTITYDPAVLAYEATEAGDFLGGPGEAQVMADASHPGTLVLGASRLGSAPAVDGEGTVARLTFRAVAPGSARINFLQPQALDGALRPLLPLRTGAARITVSG
jgi:hypothetical protein